MKLFFPLLGLVCLSLMLSSYSCNVTPTSDQIQGARQENVLKEAANEVGIPNITNFQEMKLLKMIYELRDQANLVTYTYILNEYTGKYIFVGETVGFGIPYATQFSASERVAKYSELTGTGNVTLPQAEPNGIYPPNSAEGTWVIMKTAKGELAPQYIEPRICVFTFRLPASQVQ